MSSRSKEFLKNLALLAGTLVVLVLFLEIFLRFSGIERLESRRPHLHQPSEVAGLHYEFVPNLKNERGYNWERVSTNSLGMRGPEPDPDKPDVAIIGDSFAFGFGVNDDEVHTSLLAEEFPGYDFLNMGVNGYNVEQEVRAYLGKFADLKPSLLIVEFVFNDMRPPSILTEELEREVYALDGYLEKGEVADEKLKESINREGTLAIPFKFWLTKHSAIFNFVEKRTKWLSFRKRDVDYVTETIAKENLAFYEEWFSKLALHPNLRASQKLFVIWPERSLHVESREFLKALAKRHGFQVLDLYDVFGMEYPHLSWDWHPNADAHAKTAEVMAQFIHARNLLPASASGSAR